MVKKEHIKMHTLIRYIQKYNLKSFLKSENPRSIAIEI